MATIARQAEPSAADNIRQMGLVWLHQRGTANIYQRRRIGPDNHADVLVGKLEYDELQRADFRVLHPDNGQLAGYLSLDIDPGKQRKRWRTGTRFFDTPSAAVAALTGK